MKCHGDWKPHSSILSCLVWFSTLHYAICFEAFMLFLWMLLHLIFLLFICSVQYTIASGQKGRSIRSLSQFAVFSWSRISLIKATIWRKEKFTEDLPRYNAMVCVRDAYWKFSNKDLDWIMVFVNVVKVSDVSRIISNIHSWLDVFWSYNYCSTSLSDFIGQQGSRKAVREKVTVNIKQPMPYTDVTKQNKCWLSCQRGSVQLAFLCIAFPVSAN